MYHHYPSCAIHIQRLKPPCKGQHDRLSPDLRFKHGKNSTKRNETHVSFLHSEFNEKLLNNHGIWVVGSDLPSETYCILKSHTETTLQLQSGWLQAYKSRLLHGLYLVFFKPVFTLQYTWSNFHSPQHLPSGKRLHTYGKSPFFMGKSTINVPLSILPSGCLT